MCTLYPVKLKKEFRYNLDWIKTDFDSFFQFLFMFALYIHFSHVRIKLLWL